MAVLKSDITVLQSLGYSLLGIAVVFAALILLMYIIKIMSAVMKSAAKNKEVPAPAAVPVAPVVVNTPVTTCAPGSAGDIKLYNVPDKTAAMIMAIVANKLKKPLNELRFKSIREVK